MDRSQPTEQLHVRQLPVKCRTVYAMLSVPAAPQQLHIQTMSFRVLKKLFFLQNNTHVHTVALSLVNSVEMPVEAHTGTIHNMDFVYTFTSL